MCCFSGQRDLSCRLFRRFLLAQLHLNSLSRLLRPKDIRHALKHLSESIDDAYEQVMERIDEQFETYRNLARKVLSWVSYSRRLLSFKELQHAMAITPGMKEVNEDDIYHQDLLMSVCAGLVVFDKESGIVRFVRE
jgi:arginine utilization protein RocB